MRAGEPQETLEEEFADCTALTDFTVLHVEPRVPTRATGPAAAPDAVCVRRLPAGVFSPRWRSASSGPTTGARTRVRPPLAEELSAAQDVDAIIAGIEIDW